MKVPVIACGDSKKFDPQLLRLFFTATLLDGDTDLATDEFVIYIA